MSRPLALLLLVAALVGGIWLLARYEPDGLDPARDGPDRAPDEIEGGLIAVGVRDAASGAVPDVHEQAVGLQGTGTTALRGAVTVTVLVADGTPYPGIAVMLVDTAIAVSTDDAGCVRYPDLPYDGSVSVIAIEPDGLTALSEPARVEGPDVTLRVHDAVRLIARTRDAETGDMVGTFISLRGDSPHVEGMTGLVIEHQYVLRARRGGRITVAFDVDGRGGFVTAGPWTYTVRRSPYATRMTVDIPLRRAVPLTVLVKDHEGAVAETAVLDVHVGGFGGLTFEDLRIEPDGFGNRRVPGVPFYAREQLSVFAEVPGTAALELAETWLSTDPDRPVVVEIRLPKAEPIESLTGLSDIGFGIGGGAGGAFRGRPARRGPTPPGRAKVVVKRFNGEPAVGAEVTLGGAKALSNAKGIARFTGVEPGTHEVSVSQRGFLGVADELVVNDHGESEIMLTERRGAALELQVVDDQDRPLPYATVTLLNGGRPTNWPFLEGDVQRVDPYTDHRGRRTYARLPPDLRKVRVEWGARIETVRLDLVEGVTARVRVVLNADPGAPR